MCAHSSDHGKHLMDAGDPLAGGLYRVYSPWLPGKRCLDRSLGRFPEWNIEGTAAYHWGASKGGTARKGWLSEVFGLDDAVQNEYDSRLSRNGDGSGK